jgi:hypothetical protein
MVKFATLLALGALFLAAGCARRLPRREATVADPSTFDREAERRAVLEVALEYHREEGILRLVVDPVLEAVGDDYVLPSKFDAEGEGVRADWTAHAKTRPAPEDLRAAVPIEWFSGDDMASLTHEGGLILPGDLDTRWVAFHERFPASSGWISLSDVGFSKSRNEAAVYVGRQRAPLIGSGHCLLLRKRGGRWTIVADATAWVS